jgi:hypothetical protein
LDDRVEIFNAALSPQALGAWKRWELRQIHRALCFAHRARWAAAILAPLATEASFVNVLDHIVDGGFAQA